MSRYFLEVSYKGTNYSGFQIQQNANSIQSEIEKAFQVLQKQKVGMIGSSRTDAGVHALQNFFHFDFEHELNVQFIYRMNSILPNDIVVKKILPVGSESHCRFDAISREYKFFIYQQKNPFLSDRAFYFPYKLQEELMHEAAETIKRYSDFTSFSKRNTQVKTFICNILESKWVSEESCLIFHVRANRFLRGMVRALVATMLKVGREKITVQEFKDIIEGRDCTKANFAAPAHGLFLIRVHYPEEYFG
jgi:tRNA pseudouridine38-40 synthase